jgi:hypothetical protein
MSGVGNGIGAAAIGAGVGTGDKFRGARVDVRGWDLTEPGRLLKIPFPTKTTSRANGRIKPVKMR